MTKKILIRTLMTLTLGFTILLNAQDLTDIRICIDPGHGGHESDDRFIEVTGFWESESNLSKAKYLDEILSNLGANVKLTRYGNDGITDDLSLSERDRLANQFGADVFHSIHSNGYNGERNSTLMLYRGWDLGVTGYNSYFGQTVTGALFPESGEMATIMANQLYSANRTTSRSVRGDWSFYPEWNGQGLGVLRTLTMPGTLSEGSFHDYIPESWRLQNKSYKKSEAWALAKSFLHYFDVDMFPSRNLAGIVRDSFEEVPYFYLSSTKDKYRPVNNITVTLKPVGRVFRGDSMNNGFFFFDSLAPGDYSVVVEAEGYYPDSANVTISEGFYNFQDFKLFSNQPPFVKSNTPAEGTQAYPAWEAIKISFTKPMDTTSVRIASYTDPAAPLTFTWAENLMNVSVQTDTFAFETDYTFTIAGSALDIYGLQLDGNNDGTGGDDFVLHFSSSAADITAPYLLTNYPIYNQKDVELLPLISLTYDEILAESALTVEIFQIEEYANNYFVPFTIGNYIVNKQSIVALFPQEKLKSDQTYKIRINPGLKDRFGNEVATKKTLSFRTGVVDWNITNIDDFESGVITNWKTPGYSGSTTGLEEDTLSSRDRDNEIVNLLTASNQSMQICYSWKLDAGEWLLRDYLADNTTPKNIYFDNNVILQVYVFGDGNNNQFRFALDDGTQHEASLWYTLDWLGWKLVSWDLANDGTGQWSDLGDGILGNNLRIDSFQLTYNSTNPEAAKSGTLYFDDLRFVTPVAVAIAAEGGKHPESFPLLQNYPNPFNPSTTISYRLPASGLVNLAVYNLAGQRVQTLVDRAQPAGSYSIQWDASDVGSGVYLIRIQAEGFSTSQKCILLK